MIIPVISVFPKAKSLRFLWIRIQAKFEVLYISNFKNFIYFQEIAWKALFGRYGIIDGREVKSKGGYKYYQVALTKLPCSKKHTYE